MNTNKEKTTLEHGYVFAAPLNEMDINLILYLCVKYRIGVTSPTQQRYTMKTLHILYLVCLICALARPDKAISLLPYMPLSPRAIVSY